MKQQTQLNPPNRSAIPRNLIDFVTGGHVSHATIQEANSPTVRGAILVRLQISQLSALSPKFSGKEDEPKSVSFGQFINLIFMSDCYERELST